MRRSGSSSCMLRPKNSFSAEDLQRLASETKPTTTVLTVNKLPSYCTDRLYMLSELQVHANSIQFLCDLSVSKNRTISSTNITTDDGVGASHDVSNNNIMPAVLPPSIILYLLWKPNTYPTPQSFCDGPISESVRQCLLVNGEDDVPSMEELERLRSSSSKAGSPRTPPYNHSPRGRHQQQNNNNIGFEQVNFDKLKRRSSNPTAYDDGRETSTSPSPRSQKRQQNEQITKVYVVIDRISPSCCTTETNMDESINNDCMGEMPNFPDISSSISASSSFDPTTDYSKPASIQPILSQTSSNNNSQQQQSKEQYELQQINQHNTEIKTAEKLARAVSSSTFLRNRIDGVSIGITSDARAAPGLEACMDAVVRGSKERRLVVSRDGRKIRKMMNEREYNKTRKKESQQQVVERSEQSLDHLRDASPERSPVAIVAIQPDDLECTDTHHHHHSSSEADSTSSRILQCRVSTEWNGKGECSTFTDRAMKDWRRAWCVAPLGSGIDDIGTNNGGTNNGRAVRPKVPRISKHGRVNESRHDEDENVNEPISTAMVIIFLVVIAAYVWEEYGDAILSYVSK